MRWNLKEGIANLALKALGASKEDIRLLIQGGKFKGFPSTRFITLANEGFKCAELVYFIVNDIAQSGAGVPLLLDDQPDWVVDLMGQPEKKTETRQGKLYKTWMYEQLVYKQLSGAAYAEATTLNDGRRNAVEDMPIIRPDWISPIEKSEEELIGWRVARFGMQKNFGIEDIFFSKKLDPLRLNHGFAPLAAANKALAQRNEISRLNMQVLRNDGAVPGIMKLNSPNDKFAKTPNKEAMELMKEEVNEKLGKGADGEIAVTNWDMVYERLGQTGKEMDWSKTKTQNAREIAIGNGYPPFLLGLPEGATFNNVESAEQFLWNHTIIPWVEGILCDMTVHFREVSGDSSIELKLDKKEILSIQQQMVKKREADRKDFDSGLITLQEWRERNGFEENPTGDFKIDFNRISLPMLDE